MTPARTVWRVVGVPLGVYFPRARLEVSVDSVDLAVVGAIETAAERAGVELERVEPEVVTVDPGQLELVE